MRNLYRVSSSRETKRVSGQIIAVFVSAPDEKLAIQMAYEQYFARADKDFMQVEKIDLEDLVYVAIERESEI